MKLARQIGIGLVVGLSFNGARAAPSAPFFQGKTIDMVIDDGAGGAPDTEGRLVARYLPQHIPGKPMIVVHNMPSAGGVVAANYVGWVAPADGLTFEYMTAVALRAALKDPSLKVDLAAMPLIAVLPLPNVVYVRVDYGGGIHRPADILTKSGFWLAGVSPDNQKDLALRLSMDLLGLDYNYITGYRGTADGRLAIQRNEAQVTQESMPGYRTAIEPFVKRGDLTPVWYNAGSSESTGASADAVKGIPATSFADFYKAHGTIDTNSELYRARMVVSSGSEFGRMMVKAPGSPPEALAALQQAFAALGDDPAFREDAIKTIQYVPSYTHGEEIERSLKEELKPDDEIVNFLHRYIEKGEGLAKR
ncbi:MAG TPA: hypothetical protein VG271_16230 [Beijerinckiaceae bacterium]|nr:hypothetical protein [Beijerinckiaceae bacterium]